MIRRAILTAALLALACATLLIGPGTDPGTGEQGHRDAVVAADLEAGGGKH